MKPFQTGSSSPLTSTSICTKNLVARDHLGLTWQNSVIKTEIFGELEQSQMWNSIINSYAYYHLLISRIIKKILLLLIVSIMLPRFVFGELEQFPSFKLVETCFPFFCQLKPAKNVPHSGLPEATVDGRNPAPPWMIETYEHRVKPSIYQLVQDFATIHSRIPPTCRKGITPHDSWLGLSTGTISETCSKFRET